MFYAMACMAPARGFSGVARGVPTVYRALALRAFWSIASRSGLELAKQVRGMGLQLLDNPVRTRRLCGSVQLASKTTYRDRGFRGSVSHKGN
jgi:hypothetical protein